MEGVDSLQTAGTEELDPDTVEAAVHAVSTAEFTTVIGSKHPPTFESYGLVEESHAFRLPQ